MRAKTLTIELSLVCFIHCCELLIVLLYYVVYASISSKLLVIFWFEGPKLLVTFYSGCSGVYSGSADDAPALHKFTIFQGLTDCLACHGNSLEVGILNGFIFVPLSRTHTCKVWTWLLGKRLFLITSFIHSPN